MAAALMLRTISGSTFDGSKRSQLIVSRVQWPIVRTILGSRRLNVIKRPALPVAMAPWGKCDRFFRVSSELALLGTLTPGVKGLGALEVFGYRQLLLGRRLFRIGGGIDQVAFG